MPATGKILPDADGTASANEWNPTAGPRWSLVDEDPHDSDTTAISTPDTATTRNSRFTKPACSLPAGATVDSVTLHVVARRVEAGNPTNPNIYTGWYNSVTVYTNYAAAHSLTTAIYTDYSDTWALNPETGLAWTEAEIDNMQFDIKGASSRKFVLGLWWYTTVNCTQVYMIVNFTVASGVPVMMHHYSQMIKIHRG